MRRDWKEHPPETTEEAFALARELMEQACDHAERETGERPFIVQEGNRLLVVWPDGMVTNEVTVDQIQ